MNGPIRRLAIGVLGAMAALLVAVSWFQVIPCSAQAQSLSGRSSSSGTVRSWSRCS